MSQELLYIDTIPSLIIKYLQHSLTESERETLNAWINHSHDNRFTFEELTNAKTLQLGIRRLNSFNSQEAFKRIQSKLGKP